MSRPRRGIPWWARLLGVGALGVVAGLVGAGGLAAWVGWAGADLREGADADPADCADLAAAVGAPALPAGTSDAECTYIGFQDWHLEGTMTVPRAELDAWLADLPGSPALTDTGCTDAIACVQVDLTQVDEEVDAHYLDVAVLREDDGVAEVLMSAFTT
ncbi:hypothetical protein J2S40_001022 [Nocardioides luteus]|uniref:hypothetical protein n=1 Tax=Nocardioides luteus TaxID=1844 RepID=UPI00166B6D1C|nr:hypothetical protein [Nocardioides luteus]MDR7309964.1 hypothetical protein [Nocardioides luteus]